MAKLKQSERRDFALPSKQKYPIPDKSHARNALSRAAQSNTEGSYSAVRKKVLQKFPSLKNEGGKKKKSGLQKWSK